MVIAVKLGIAIFLINLVLWVLPSLAWAGLPAVFLTRVEEIFRDIGFIGCILISLPIITFILFTTAILSTYFLSTSNRARITRHKGKIYKLELPLEGLLPKYEWKEYYIESPSFLVANNKLLIGYSISYVVILCFFSNLIGLEVLKEVSLVLLSILWPMKIIASLMLGYIRYPELEKFLERYYSGGRDLIKLYQDEIGEGWSKLRPVAFTTSIRNGLVLYMQEPYLERWLGPIIYPYPFWIYPLRNWQRSWERFKRFLESFAFKKPQEAKGEVKGALSRAIDAIPERETPSSPSQFQGGFKPKDKTHKTNQADYPCPDFPELRDRFKAWMGNDFAGTDEFGQQLPSGVVRGSKETDRYLTYGLVTIRGSTNLDTWGDRSLRILTNTTGWLGSLWSLLTLILHLLNSELSSRRKTTCAPKGISSAKLGLPKINFSNSHPISLCSSANKFFLEKELTISFHLLKESPSIEFPISLYVFLSKAQGFIIVINKYWGLINSTIGMQIVSVDEIVRCVISYYRTPRIFDIDFQLDSKFNNLTSKTFMDMPMTTVIIIPPSKFSLFYIHGSNIQKLEQKVKGFLGDFDENRTDQVTKQVIPVLLPFDKASDLFKEGFSHINCLLGIFFSYFGLFSVIGIKSSLTHQRKDLSKVHGRFIMDEAKSMEEDIYSFVCGGVFSVTKQKGPGSIENRIVGTGDYVSIFSILKKELCYSNLILSQIQSQVNIFFLLLLVHKIIPSFLTCSINGDQTLSSFSSIIIGEMSTMYLAIGSQVRDTISLVIFFPFLLTTTSKSRSEECLLSSLALEPNKISFFSRRGNRFSNNSSYLRIANLSFFVRPLILSTIKITLFLKGTNSFSDFKHNIIPQGCQHRNSFTYTTGHRFHHRAFRNPWDSMDQFGEGVDGLAKTINLGGISRRHENRGSGGDNFRGGNQEIRGVGKQRISKEAARNYTLDNKDKQRIKRAERLRDKRTKDTFRRPPRRRASSLKASQRHKSTREKKRPGIPNKGGSGGRRYERERKPYIPQFRDRLILALDRKPTKKPNQKQHLPSLKTIKAAIVSMLKAGYDYDLIKEALGITEEYNYLENYYTENEIRSFLHLYTEDREVLRRIAKRNTPYKGRPNKDSLIKDGLWDRLHKSIKVVLESNPRYLYLYEMTDRDILRELNLSYLDWKELSWLIRIFLAGCKTKEYYIEHRHKEIYLSAKKLADILSHLGLDEDTAKPSLFRNSSPLKTLLIFLLPTLLFLVGCAEAAVLEGVLDVTLFHLRGGTGLADFGLYLLYLSFILPILAMVGDKKGFNKEITRRDFLKGAAVAVAIAAGLPISCSDRYSDYDKPHIIEKLPEGSRLLADFEGRTTHILFQFEKADEAARFILKMLASKLPKNTKIIFPVSISFYPFSVRQMIDYCRLFIDFKLRRGGIIVNMYDRGATTLHLSSWARDNYLVFVSPAPESKIILVEPIIPVVYDGKNRPDKNVPDYLSAKYGIGLYKAGFYFEGGYILSSGRDVFISEELIRLNSEILVEKAYIAMRKTFGQEPIILPAVDSRTGIDSYVTFTSKDVAVVGKIPEKNGLHKLPVFAKSGRILDETAGIIGRRGYEVHRIPFLPNLKEEPLDFLMTYNNVLFINPSSIIMPIYYTSFDEEAKRVFEEVGLDVETLFNMRDFAREYGAWRCITNRVLISLSQKGLLKTLLIFLLPTLFFLAGCAEAAVLEEVLDVTLFHLRGGTGLADFGLYLSSFIPIFAGVWNRKDCKDNLLVRWVKTRLDWLRRKLSEIQPKWMKIYFISVVASLILINLICLAVYLFHPTIVISSIFLITLFSNLTILFWRSVFLILFEAKKLTLSRIGLIQFVNRTMTVALAVFLTFLLIDNIKHCKFHEVIEGKTQFELQDKLNIRLLELKESSDKEYGMRYYLEEGKIHIFYNKGEHSKVYINMKCGQSFSHTHAVYEGYDTDTEKFRSIFSPTDIFKFFDFDYIEENFRESRHLDKICCPETILATSPYDKPNIGRDIKLKKVYVHPKFEELLYCYIHKPSGRHPTLAQIAKVKDKKRRFDEFIHVFKHELEIIRDKDWTDGLYNPDTWVDIMNLLGVEVAIYDYDKDKNLIGKPQVYPAKNSLTVNDVIASLGWWDREYIPQELLEYLPHSEIYSFYKEKDKK